MPGVKNSPSIDDVAGALQRIRSQVGAQAAGLDGLEQLINDPLFRQLLHLEKALTQVKETIAENPEEFSDFKVDENGHLVEECTDSSDDDLVEHEDPSWIDDFVEKMANGRETEHITLEKQVGTSLGFSVVGLESENRGELGIFVQEIQPGTITDEDGRLKESDQILVINGKPLGPNVSHTEAIAALQAVKDSVHLIIARGPIPRQIGAGMSDSESQASEVNLQPAEKRWAHSEIIVLQNEGSGFGFGIVGGKATGVQIKTILPNGLADRDGRLQSGDTILKINDIDLSGMGSKEAATILQETGSTVKLEIARGELPTFNQLKTSPDEVFDVELTKNAGGIGIHIAGWVNDGSSGITQHGIYVKAVTPGSPAANDGRIEAGDQIIAVNGLRLDGQGVGSEEAVEALQNTGDSVHLTLSRRKRKSTRLTDEQIAQLSHYWQKVVGDKFEIIVGELTKEYENAGLGIDVEGLESDGQYKHLIRSVSASGPVGTKTGIKPGDEVLEVNGEKLIGMNHLAAVQIIRSLPEHVVLVCARRKVEVDTEEHVGEASSRRSSMSEFAPTMVTGENMVAASIAKTVLVSEDSSESSDDSEEEDDLVWIELEKGNSGLGFSILDAPDRNGSNSIRIRGLVPGGVADQNGRLSPGDQIIRVNDIKFDMRIYSLKDCVEVLKGLAPGIVKIGVRKIDDDDEPVVLEDNEDTVIEESINFEQNRNQMAALAPVIKQPIQIVPPTPPPKSPTPEPEVQKSRSPSPPPAPVEPERELLPVIQVKPGAETTDNESIFSDAQDSIVESIVSATTIHSHTKPDEPQSLLQENTAQEIKRIPEAPVQLAETKDTTDDEKLNVPSSDSEPELPQEPESIIDTREVRTIRINKGTASLGITVSPDTLNRGLVIRSVISNGAVAKHGELEAGDIIVSVNDSDVAGLETEKARQLIRHHSYHSSTVVLRYLPSTDRVASEEAAATVEEPAATVERVPSSAGLSDAYLTEATTDDERDALWNPPQPYTIAKPHTQNGSLGLTLVDYSEISHRGFDLPRGTYVKSVDQGSSAEAAGLKFGDRIIKVNGQSTVKSSHQTVIRLIKATDQEKIHLQVQPLKPQCRGDLVLYESETETTLSSSTNSNNSQILATPEIAPGEQYSVTLHKLNGSLGVSLIGNQSGDAGIRVVKITPDGAAEKDGRIQVGDEVVTINEVPLADKSQLETINLLKEHDSAKITLIRSDGAKVPYSAPAPKLTVEEEISRLRLNVSKKDVDSVEVIKLVKDFNGLGISFEDDHSAGVRVRSLSANSPASRDGRLKNGDKILAVNDTNCQHSSYRDVTDILKSSRGTIKLIVIHPSSRRDSSSTISSKHSREVQPGAETEIEIIKGSSGLGLSIAGGAETVLGCVVIHEVYPGSAAHQDGRLAPGDRIIAVNGVDISTYTHNQASEVLRKSGTRVRLRIVRDESGQSDTMKVRLNKIPGQGLGLNIENGPSGTIIFGIVPGSEASIDGTLMQGDEIIGANGVDLTGATRDRVASELKKATGTVVIEIRRPRKSQNGSAKPTRKGSHIRKVTIKRRHSQEPLGISIAGGFGSALGDVPIFIAAVDPEGPASDKLKMGERIVSINGTSSERITHNECAQLLRQSPQNVVLEMSPGDQEMQYMSQYLVQHTDRQKQPHASAMVDVVLFRGADGLGFSIVGGKDSPKGDLPIYIKTVSGGAALRSAKLKRGDQIVYVNGTSLEGYTRQDTVNMLKHLEGEIVLSIVPA